MYTPKHFQLPDYGLQLQLIQNYSLATLVTHGDDGPIIDPIPLLLRDTSPTGAPDCRHWTLRGHVARVNPVWQSWLAAGEAGRAVTAVFHGPDCYISPSWYASKAVDQRVVPTWNYLMLQAHGRAKPVDDEIWMRQLLADLTVQYEAQFESPWQLQDTAPAYMAQLLQAIVGVEIQVERVEVKAKLSQNQPAANYASVCAALAQAQPREQDVLEWMRRIR